MLVGTRALDATCSADGAIALRDGTVALTYGELRHVVERIGRAGETFPVHAPAGARDIALLADWTPDLVAALLGLATSGWSVGVLDPRWTADELVGALAQFAPSTVLATAEHAGRLVASGWEPAGSAVGATSAWTVLAAPGATPAAAARTAPGPDDQFYVGFTSGSSGAPKAFARTHRSWWLSFTGLEACVPPNDGTVLVPGPLSGSHFLFGALYGLHAGATVDLCPHDTDGALVERLLAVPRPAAIFAVPTMLARWAAVIREGSPGGPRTIFCAGARLAQDLRNRIGRCLPHTQIVEYYGASELSFVAIQTPDDGTPAGSVGRAFPGVEVAIRDDDNIAVPAGVSGRIFARSPLVFAGYRGAAPVAGAETSGDGWWTVGDHGHLDDDGALFVDGRGSALIITGGTNVQPEEVEAVVEAIPGVAACAVVGVPDRAWGEAVVAVIVPSVGADLTRSMLRGEVARRLGPAKRPRRYVAFESPLPTVRTGKVDRARVRAAVLAREGREL